MRFLKFAISGLALAFLLFPQLLLASTQITSCFDFSAVKCYEESAIIRDPNDYKKMTVKFTPTPPGLVLTQADKDWIDDPRNRGTYKVLTYACLFPKNIIPAEIKDSDSYGMCRKTTADKNNKDNEYAYSCRIGNLLEGYNWESCNKSKALIDPMSDPDFKAYSLAMLKSVNADPHAADKVIPKAVSYGSGNITCGNRTFECKRGGWFSGVKDECYCCGQCTPDDLLVVGNTVLKWLFGIVGAIGLAMFVWGGFKFITSAGNTGEVAAGKKAITNAVVGLVIMFSAGAVVMRIQSSLGIDESVRVSISKDGPAFVASTPSTTAAKTEVHGTTKIGESCLYNQSTKSSQCGEGLYCYSIDQTKGVCLPQNPEKTVGFGGDCYILPGDGSKDMCKVGTCQAADKTAGTKGTCPTVEDNPSVTIGDTCKTNADCAGKALFTESATCYKKSGSSTGKCIPSVGRGQDKGESCYVLPGSPNDCATGLLCVQNPDASDPKLNRTTGELGVCYNYKNTTRGYSCTKAFECASVDSCIVVPKAANQSYCLKTGTTFNDAEDAVCESVSVYSGGPSIEVDTCVSGLTCMEVDGSMRCSR